ncbi:Uncharacterised protein [Salmonella enterica]|nr:Uncharacterised protein [Salmonella enterica]
MQATISGKNGPSVSRLGCGVMQNVFAFWHVSWRRAIIGDRYPAMVMKLAAQ